MSSHTPPQPSSADGLPSGVRHRSHEMPGRPFRLSVRLSVVEHELIVDAAAAARLTPAGFTGKAAVAFAGRTAGPAVGMVDALRELQQELFAARRALNMLGANVHRAAAAYDSTGELPIWLADALALCRNAVVRLDGVTGQIDRRLR
jgi:hypothetical protein